MIRVPVISFTIFYQWFCLPFFWIILVSPTLGTRKVNALDRHSDTPLSWAARSGHLDAVREDPATKHAKIFGDAVGQISTRYKGESIGRCIFSSFLVLGEVAKESCLHKMICLFPRSRSSSSIGQIPCWSLGYRP